MPDNKITLFAQSPVQIGGERYFEEEFEVDTQKQADELIACGAAVDPNAVAKALDTAEQTEADRLAAEAASGSGSDNVVTLVQPPESAEDRIDAINKATVSLQEENNAEKFTTANGPTVEALTEVLGWKPSAAERNQVWLELAPAE